jgi:hypothetical protein
VPVWLDDAVPVWLDDAVPVCEDEAVPVFELLAVAVRDEDAVPVGLDDGVALRLEDDVAAGVTGGVCDGECVADGVGSRACTSMDCTTQLMESATSSAPVGVSAMNCGVLNLAEERDVPSCDMPRLPLPATTVTEPAAEFT